MKRTAFLIVIFSLLVFLTIGQVSDSFAYGPEHPAEAAEGHHGPHLTWLHYAGRFINFSLLVLLVYYLLFKMARIHEVFARQREEIQKEIEEARQRRENAEARWAAIQANLSRLNEEIEKLRQHAKEEAEKEHERIITEARAEVDRLKRMAEEEIERATLYATREIRAYAAEVAVRVSQRLIRDRLTPEDHEALIQSSLRYFKTRQDGKIS